MKHKYIISFFAVLLAIEARGDSFFDKKTRNKKTEEDFDLSPLVESLGADNAYSFFDEQVGGVEKEMGEGMVE